MANALSRFAELVPRAEMSTPLVNGAVAARFDPSGEFDTAMTFLVEDDRTSRTYVMRSPPELCRLDTVAELRR